MSFDGQVRLSDDRIDLHEIHVLVGAFFLVIDFVLAICDQLS
jgi:hypothetical protein